MLTTHSGHPVKRRKAKGTVSAQKWYAPPPQKFEDSILSNSPHNTQQNCLPNNCCPMLTNPSPPTSQQLHHMLRHHPRDTKQAKIEIPRALCIRTVKRKVIHRFPTILTHTIAVNNANIPLPQIIQFQTLTFGCCPSEGGKKTL